MRPLGTTRTHHALFLAVLILSAYVHLWNPAGFPDLFFDEGIYMRRAMTTMDTGNPQESYLYDHPYFGQIVLAGFLKIVGFPETVQGSLEASYMAPRILMGLFAVLDTFLIYKITEVKFGRKTAILAAALFAVMPMTWMFRRILLDSILMPFLLSSVLLALYSVRSRHKNLLVMGSSVLLGLCIFTKVSAVTMIPVVAYVLVSGHGPRILARWTPPVLAIPLAWPGTALGTGHLDLWLKDVLWQASRGSGQFPATTAAVFGIDPAMMALAFASFVYAAWRKDLMLLTWFAPFLIFVNTVGFFQYFHYMLIFPVICIGAAHMIMRGIGTIKAPAANRVAYGAAVGGFLVYGTVVTSMFITLDLTSAQFEALEYTIQNFDDDEMTLVAGPVYSWVLSDVHQRENVFLDYSGLLYHEYQTPFVFVVVDPHFVFDQEKAGELREIVHDTEQIQQYRSRADLDKLDSFPYWGLVTAREGDLVTIRTDRAG